MANQNQIQFEAFTDIDAATDFVLANHNGGYCYSNISVNGVDMIVRTNKDHGMNRDNNWNCHVLSLTTGGDSYSYESAGKWIEQNNVDASGSDVEMEIYNFIKNTSKVYA